MFHCLCIRSLNVKSCRFFRQNRKKSCRGNVCGPHLSVHHSVTNTPLSRLFSQNPSQAFVFGNNEWSCKTLLYRRQLLRSYLGRNFVLDGGLNTVSPCNPGNGIQTGS